MSVHSIEPFISLINPDVELVVGRVKGNQKDWHYYEKPIVYATQTFYDTAAVLEAKTRGLSETAFHMGKKIVGIDDFKSADKDFYYYQHPEEFTSYEKAVRYLETQETHLKAKGCPKLEVNAGKMIEDLKWIARRGGFEDGHWVSSAMNTKKSVREGFAPIFTRKMLGTPVFKTIAEPTNPKYRSYVIIPVYEDESSHPSDVKLS